MKTAISIPQNLFLTVNEMAKKLNLSRSKFITTVIQDYVAMQRNRELFESLNEAYSEEVAPLSKVVPSAVDTKEEIDIRMQGKKYYSRLLEKEKW